MYNLTICDKKFTINFEMKSLFKNSTKIAIILSILLLIAVFAFFVKKTNFLSSQITAFSKFVAETEAKTFDIRQNTLSKNRHPVKDIVIVGIDNVSHEYLTSYFGSWPLPRKVYADFIKYIETQNPAAIGIDVLFVGSWHKNKENDLLLAETFKKYDNVFGAIYFDDYSLADRTPLKLPNSAEIKINSKSKIHPYNYKNLRELYPEFLESAQNLGHLNLERSKDGVIRTLPLFIEHQSKYYPNFALKILDKYNKNNSKTFEIDKNYNLIIANKKIPILNTTEAVLNWYEINPLVRDSSFEFVSFKDVFEKMNSKQKNPDKNPFKDKIVLLGFTADSLSDLKTIPTTKLIPGVEIYATFISNAIDNSIIKKTTKPTDYTITILLVTLTLVLLFKIKNSWVNLFTTLAVSTIYIWLAFFVMKYFNLWIPIAVPVIAIVLSYIATLAIKYFFKSEDYDYIYKLATNDSLTGLYNHRFFQDQMKINLEYCKRYNSTFSLILIDIDKFKLFNDKYGHLIGDEVLRQVSQLLKSSIRKADIICRYGGEEITIILPHTSNENAYILANKLCKIIGEHKFVVSKNLTVNVTISLGVSSYPDSGADVPKLIEIADKIMYNAKETGRNKVGNPDSIKDSET